MTGTQGEPKTFCGGWKPTIEPVMVVVAYLLSVSSSPLTDLVMRQSCRQLHLDPSNCSNDEATEEEIHRMSSTFSMWHMIIGTLPGCIMSLFTGPWSDTNGRKPLIIIGIVGTALYQASLSYMSTIPDLHPYYLLAASIPSIFTGGTLMIILNAFCYLIDITTIENRAIRITILMQGSAIGGVVAQFVAPPLEALGYDWLFASNTILLVICAFYVVFVLPETVKIVEEDRRTLFTFDHLADSFRTFFKKRPNHARGILFCLLIASCCLLLVNVGEPDVKYLSTIKKFNWTLKDYSDYTATSTVLGALATFSGVYIGLNVLKLNELTFAVVIMTTLVTSSVWTAWSRSSVEFYIVTQIKLFAPCLAPVVKGVMSKVVPLSEVSRVIAFQSSADAFMPQISAVLYTKFYNLVVGFDPFAVYYLSVLLNVIGTVFFGVSMILYLKGNFSDTTNMNKGVKTGEEQGCDSNIDATRLEVNSGS